MKSHLRIYSLLSLLLLATAISAKAGNIEKTKKISKTYALSQQQGVKITNKFGKVDIRTWERNEVKAEATIRVTASSEQAAQQLLDNIQIQSSDGNPVNFTTRFSGGQNRQSKNSQIHIDYVVYMPARTDLEIKNEFGNTRIPDWTGNLRIEQSFGDVITGRLSGEPDIQVKFGTLRSSSIRNGDIKISYSDLTIEGLQGIISGKIDFCKVVSLGLEKSLEQLDLKISYSDVKLNLNELNDLQLDIRTNFGDVQNKSGIHLEENSKSGNHGPNFNKKFSGKQGSGKTEINIFNSFGDIILL
ncbi:hypothetical protein GCM10027051_08470 [Niabella terrae]